MSAQARLPTSVRAGGIGAKRLIYSSLIVLFGLVPPTAATAVAAAGLPRPTLVTTNTTGMARPLTSPLALFFNFRPIEA